MSSINSMPSHRSVPRVGLVLVALCRATTVAAQPMVASDAQRAHAMTTDSMDWKAVDVAMGRASVAQPGDVHRYNFPRADLRVTAAGVVIKPSFALGGWVAMKAVAGGVMAMGDLVLIESELAPVISQLQAGGIEQTAIHHHLLHESPRVYYVHIHGHGDAIALAKAVRSAVALTKTPAPAATAATPSAAFALDTAAIARTIGFAGRVNGGVYQVSAPRTETVRDGDVDVPSSMGLGTAINFQPTGNGKAAITGDFVMIASEVNAVIRTLRKDTALVEATKDIMAHALTMIIRAEPNE